MNAWDPSRYDVFLLDVDGVLVQERQLIEGAVTAVNTLRDVGHVLILTNNSTRSREQHASLLSDLGIVVRADDIIPSSYVAARHLQEMYGPITVWPVGEKGLTDEMIACGHRIASRPEDAAWIVVGMDRSVDYHALADGLRALEGGARFLATNDDGTYPTPRGVFPGAGAIVGAFRGMGFEPEIKIGKPSRLLFDVALEATGDKRSRTLMIGDRLETDIAGAISSGVDSLLVFSGISQPDDILRTGIGPTWTSASLAAAVNGEVLPADPALGKCYGTSQQRMSRHHEVGKRTR